MATDLYGIGLCLAIMAFGLTGALASLRKEVNNEATGKAMGKTIV